MPDGKRFSMCDAFLERNRTQSDAQIIDSVPRAVGRLVVWVDDTAEIATVSSKADAMIPPMTGSPSMMMNTRMNIAGARSPTATTTYPSVAAKL
jgi:hypothetical protein